MEKYTFIYLMLHIWVFPYIHALVFRFRLNLNLGSRSVGMVLNFQTNTDITDRAHPWPALWTWLRSRNRGGGSKSGPRHWLENMPSRPQHSPPSLRVLPCPVTPAVRIAWLGGGEGVAREGGAGAGVSASIGLKWDELATTCPAPPLGVPAEAGRRAPALWWPAPGFCSTSATTRRCWPSWGRCPVRSSTWPGGGGHSTSAITTPWWTSWRVSSPM